MVAPVMVVKVPIISPIEIAMIIMVVAELIPEMSPVRFVAVPEINDRGSDDHRRSHDRGRGGIDFRSRRVNRGRRLDIRGGGLNIGPGGNDDGRDRNWNSDIKTDAGLGSRCGPE
jgi:hypothetical protein